MDEKHLSTTAPQRNSSHTIDWGEIFDHQTPDSIEDVESILRKVTKYQFTNSGSVFRKFEFTFPTETANFLIKLANLPEDPSILFARNDSGILPFCVRQFRPNARFTFYSDDINIHAYHSCLFPSDRTPSPKALLDLATEENEKFDLVIGGVKLKEHKFPFQREEDIPGVKRVRSDTGPSGYDEQKFLIALSKLLKDDGKLITDMWEYNVYPYVKNREEYRLWLQNCCKVTGLSVNAVIEEVAGAAGALSGAEPVIVISSKAPQGKVFSAQYSYDEQIRETIAENFLKQSQAKRVHAGYWSSLESYNRNERLRHVEQVRLRASRSGLSPTTIRNIFGQINAGVSSKAENVFYIKYATFVEEETSVVMYPTDTHLKSWVEVWVNPEKALADYIVWFFNESELGKMIVHDLIYEQDYDSNLLVSAASILECEVYLPDRQTQEEVIRNRNKLASLRSEIDENLLRLWRKPKDFDNVRKNIKRINNEDTFSTWIDQLPFPLASVLWSYQTQSRTEKEKYEKLLHFFEAYAEFLCIVHLSALASSSSLWCEIGPKIRKQIGAGHVQMSRPAFGTWLTLLEIMMKFVRDGIREDKFRPEILNAYKVNLTAPIEQLSNSSIIHVLKLAVAIRNKLAHGGAVGQKQAHETHEKLAFGLQQLRELITGVWEYYDLVLSGSGKYSGGEYLYEVERITGNRTPFERVELSTVEPLEHGRLHLVSRETSKAIELLPFIQVVPSPSTDVDACYFYSRIESGTNQARFISYHFDRDSEIHTKIDADIAAALRLFEG